MSRYVISVGGTGQHIGLALTRLVYMRALRNDIRLIAIDPDNQTGLPRLLEEPAGMKGERHPLKLGGVFAPFDVSKVGTAPFQKMFDSPDYPLQSDLFESLFDADSASIPIAKGMYGTPCVGATVFAQGVHSTGLEGLLKPLANASEVYVCGSVVGGTGAGVIHKLVGEIRRHYKKELYGIFMLPWFDIGSGGGEKGAITPAIIQRNAKHGIKYFYEHTIPALTTSVLLGYPNAQPTQVLRPVVVKNGDMRETPHYLHLVAAHSLVTLPNAHTAHRGVRAYSVVHDGQNEGWLLDAPWDAKQPSLRLLLRAHRVLLNLLSFVVTPANKKKILDFYQAGRIARSTLHAGASDAWGDLHKSITDNQGSVEQQGEFAGQVLAEMERIVSEVRFCVDWMAQLYPDDVARVPQDRLMDELRQGSRAGAESSLHWPRLAAIWRGSALGANPTSPNSGAEVARHHADLILKEGLRL